MTQTVQMTEQFLPSVLASQILFGELSENFLEN